MVDLGKFLDGSLLAADAEILPEYQVLVRCQDAVEQGIDLLGDFKTGRTVEGMMVIAVIRDAVLGSEVLPPVLDLHVGVLLVKEFPVDVHLLLLYYLVIIRLAGLRGMAAAFGLIADAQGTDAHQILLDSHVTEQLLPLLGVEHLTLPVNPAGAESYLMGCQHHGLKDDAAVIDFIAVAPVGEDEDDGRRTVIGIASGSHHLGVHFLQTFDECRILHGNDQNSLDGILEGSAATWGGPTAGIRHVTTKTTASGNAGQCYNMAGQRVTAGTKGLLIIDGRKILHK